jgi:hypothetical protein
MAYRTAMRGSIEARRWGLALAGAGWILASSAALAQQAEPDASPTISRSFGDTGLMARFNSSEQYGAVQARTGLYTAHNAVSQTTGITSGFEDDVTSIVTPVNAILPLPALGRGVHLKLGYANILSRGASGGHTRIDNDSQVAMAQAVWLIGDDALVGAGVIHEVSDVALRHNGGEIVAEGNGLRFDMLYRLAPQWGASLRVSRLSGDIATTIPHARLGVIVSRQPFRRLYSEAALVGTYRAAQSALVPKGWIIRPALAFVWQDSAFRTTSNSLDATVPARQESYMMAIATLRMERDGFRPWRVMPYGEVGFEQEVRNSLALVDDDPTTLYLKGGAAMNLGGRGRLDLYTARRDSMKGSFQSTTINLLLSMAF